MDEAFCEKHKELLRRLTPEQRASLDRQWNESNARLEAELAEARVMAEVARTQLARSCHGIVRCRHRSA